jgi:hypothetical protein
MKRKRLPLLAGKTAWYEVVEYFDSEKRTALPVAQGKAFILGNLEQNPGITIVEVDDAMDAAHVRRLGEWLSNAGIEALIMNDSVRFMKLRRASLEDVKHLMSVPLAVPHVEGDEVPTESPPEPTEALESPVE